MCALVLVCLKIKHDVPQMTLALKTEEMPSKQLPSLAYRSGGTVSVCEV